MRTTIDTKEWFDEWFNTYYYHLLYQQRNNSEAQLLIDNLVQVLAIHPQQHILDVACGKGRHAIYLNQKGFNVVGIDLSANNIQQAQTAENERLHFYKHDMREVFRPAYFDVIVNLFTSFGYFDTDEENLQAATAIAASLKKGGTWVLDFFNTTKVVQQLRPYESKTIADITFHIHKKVENQVIIKDILFEDKGTSYAFQERVKAIRREDFLEYFRQIGLEVVSLFGDYHCNAFDEQTADRMIFVLRKP